MPLAKYQSVALNAAAWHQKARLMARRYGGEGVNRGGGTSAHQRIGASVSA
jgi:hypothetical protein